MTQAARSSLTRALISVSDKTGIVEFARALAALGVELLSTGGTARLLARVRPGGHRGVGPHRLSGDARRPREDAAPDDPRRPAGAAGPARAHEHHRRARHRDRSTWWSSTSIRSSRPSAGPTCTLEDAIENIDIGGPAMVRSAAKNCARRRRASPMPRRLRRGARRARARRPACREQTRFRLAVAAFNRIATYDAAISDYLSRIRADGSRRRVSRLRPTAASQAAGPALRREPAPARRVLPRPAAPRPARS